MGSLGKTAQNGKKAASARATRPDRPHPAIAKLAVALSEYKEAVEQQAATAEILRALSRSSGNPQPVFDAILKSALRLCEAHLGLLNLYDGEHMRTVAHSGSSPEYGRWVFERGAYKPQAFLVELIGKRKAVNIADLRETPSYKARRPAATKMVEAGGGRSFLAVPLLKGGRVIGAISIYRPEVRPFTKKQITILSAFADQAAIAIENARLFNETKESLERQTATSEILGVISSSPTDVQPVFDAIATSAVRLLGGFSGAVTRRVGNMLHLAAHTAVSKAADEAFKKTFPSPLSSGRAAARAAATAAPAFVIDIETDPRFSPGDLRMARARGYRSALAVPMMHEGSVIGTISVGRREPGPFKDRQIDLLKTFADQAVIAIENARLFNETKEALEQQTAISEVLRVISGSPTDMVPVLQAVAERAMRICEASDASVVLVEGDQVRSAAGKGSLLDARPIGSTSPLKGSVVGHAVLERRAVQVDDISVASEEKFPFSREMSQKTGVRTVLAVPLLRENDALGAILLRRKQVRPFSPQQIALLKTFADQAAIAIENVRLFNETKEALERQTATSEVLKAISRSTFDLNVVLQVLIENATRLAGASKGFMFRFDGEFARMAYSYNAAPAYAALVEANPIPPGRGSLVGRTLLERQPVHIPDALADKEFTWHEAQRLGGFRSMLGVPMIREGNLIGVIAMWCDEVKPFTERQIELASTFADQAVIAIENVRLFNETNEALERQTATADILRVISSSPTDVQPVFDTIVRHAAALCGSLFASVFQFDGELLHLGASNSTIPDFLQRLRARYPMLPNSSQVSGRVVLSKSVVRIEDALQDMEYDKQFAVTGDWRRMLGVPMLREGRPLGVVVVAWAEPGPIPKVQEELLQTFADQAAIAIENVRLFKELEARNKDLGESLEQQTATAGILRVMSSSRGDVQPVFSAIASSALRLFDGLSVAVVLARGERIELAAMAADPDMEAKWRAVFPLPLDRTSISGRTIVDRAAQTVPEIRAPEVPARAQELSYQVGARALLTAPMMREGVAIGAIVLFRSYPGDFTAKQQELLKTFADQAVIAVENVRLFNEINEALKQQTSTAEVLKLISRTTFELEKVLQTLLDNAARLSGAVRAAMLRPDAEGNYRPAVTFNYDLHGPLMQRLRERPIRPGRDSITGRALLEKRPIHVPDVLADREYGRQDLTDVERYRTVLAVPMLRDGEAIGLISLIKGEDVDPFTDKQMEVVTTFADQAVIAIENVRLFKEIEEKSAQLEVANQHKSEFLANMSHELRTPLNAIIGFSEVLMERMFGEVNEKQADYLKDIHESGKHLLSLINDILDLSKIEAGRMELDLASFHLPTAISNAMTLVRERAQRHGIQLGLEVDARLGDFNADERKVKQILLNLLSNAVKFTPEGGRVEVSAKMDTDQVAIAVRDTGVGIAPEDQAALFEEFKQVGKDSTRKAEGTGLGLALTKRFVELHGGEIRVDSAPGKGSTFTVTLPLRS